MCASLGGSIYEAWFFIAEHIEEKQYASALIAKGILAERIHKYGFAFEGKTVKRK